MSTLLPTSVRATLHDVRVVTISMPNWLREPLLHFVVLGRAAVRASIISSSAAADDPRTIVVDADGRRQATQVFKAARGREPNAEELYALRRVWLDNEVLYREGLALQVDKGDTAIRERVIFKALSVVDAGIKLPPVDERAAARVVRAESREVRRARALRLRGSGARGRHVRSRGARVRRGVECRHAGRRARPACACSRAGRTTTSCRATARSSPKALEAAPVGEWRALPSREGWRVMRLESMTPAEAGRISRRCAASCCRTGPTP